MNGRERLRRQGRVLAAVAWGVVAVWTVITPTVEAGSQPTRAKHGMVASQDAIASQVGVDVLQDGGNAVDAAVATAFALAVVHPTAGNLGGGGFLLYKPCQDAPEAYDFREIAPAAAHPEMFLTDGRYDRAKHHDTHLSVGVPGTVAGLHQAWSEHGSLPWRRLVEPAIRLAGEGFVVTDGLARSLRGAIPRFRPHPASMAQFTKDGQPYQPGDVLRQPDLAASLERIADAGPAGFYQGETARLLAQDMQAHGGILTEADLAAYTAKKRTPVTGTYRGLDVISFPPPSSGGTVLIGALHVLEGYDLAADGFGSAINVHRYAETMRRMYANRAKLLGDPDFNDLPIEKLTSKSYADELRATIRDDVASKSEPVEFTWAYESDETTHLSVVDKDRNAVALTYTLEYGYGSGIVAPGTGFLLNNEMGDFNAGPGLTNRDGLIGSTPNLAEPGKRMLSSMSPTILLKEGELFMVTGSPGGRTIINTVTQTILNVVDYGMNAQEAVDAGRIHHQWLPDRIMLERRAFSPDTIRLLETMGHTVTIGGNQGAAQVIIVDSKTGMLEGGSDRRVLDGAAVGY